MEPIDKLKLQTSDNHIVEMTFDQTKMSGMITDLLKEMGGVTNQVVPMPQVDNESMQPILKYLEYHEQHPEEHENYRGDDKGCEDVGAWDKEFIGGLSRELLAKVTLAANYLAINDLLMLACKHIAFIIKDMTANQRREYFGSHGANDGTNETDEPKYVRESRINCPSCGQSNRKDCQMCLKCSNSLENNNNAMDQSK